MSTSRSTSSKHTSHLQPEIWAKVNRLHIRKAIAEFAHELLIEPEFLYSEQDWGYYTLATDFENIKYHFRAKKLMLDHWYISLDSIVKFENDIETQLDSLNFIIEISQKIGLTETVLPTYLEEISSTLFSAAYKYASDFKDSEELTNSSFQEIEHAMIEGHPTFVANNGRIGFDSREFHSFAPEAHAEIAFVWLAGHKNFTTFSSIEAFNYQKLIEEELGIEALENFYQFIKAKGANPHDYVLIPVHPWQWDNKLSHIFAADIAVNNLIYLGEGKDNYLAQQSIRTFFNITNPQKLYVKTALSILNMGFMRGLSPYYMATTPEINQWLYDQLSADDFLAGKGFRMLREVATVGFRNHYYERAIKQDTPYKKMIAALWRENPVNQIKEGQKLMTMAAFLHVDKKGVALLPELIKSSGLTIADWLSKYFDCYLSPLLHCFYQHDIIFMPHGENLIMVLENNMPVGTFMKDLAEEVNLYNTTRDLPEKVKRIAVDFPEEIKSLAIFTDVFDCIFRYISHILVEHADFSEELFWQLVAECILQYQEAHPEMDEKFEKYDLFVPEFKRSCLNRLQLNNNKQMIDLADPAKNLKFVGMLENPVARYRGLREERVRVEVLEV